MSVLGGRKEKGRLNDNDESPIQLPLTAKLVIVAEQVVVSRRRRGRSARSPTRATLVSGREFQLILSELFQ